MLSFKLRRIALANAGNLGGGSGPVIDASALPALLKAYQDVRTGTGMAVNARCRVGGGGADNLYFMYLIMQGVDE